jgi:hypothetical protein
MSILSLSTIFGIIILLVIEQFVRRFFRKGAAAQPDVVMQRLLRRQAPLGLYAAAFIFCLDALAGFPSPANFLIARLLYIGTFFSSLYTIYIWNGK